MRTWASQCDSAVLQSEYAGNDGKHQAQAGGPPTDRRRGRPEPQPFPPHSSGEHTKSEYSAAYPAPASRVQGACQRFDAGVLDDGSEFDVCRCGYYRSEHSLDASFHPRSSSSLSAGSLAPTGPAERAVSLGALPSTRQAYHDHAAPAPLSEYSEQYAVHKRSHRVANHPLQSAPAVYSSITRSDMGAGERPGRWAPLGTDVFVEHALGER